MKERSGEQARTCDVAIVGGGLVGASLALALAPLGLQVVVIEATSPDALEQPSFDERTTALANGSIRVFRTLGVWERMEEEACPIHRIHVSDQGRFGAARIDAAEQGLTALGYVIANRAIGAALVPVLRATAGIDHVAPARVTGTWLEGDWRVVQFEQEGEARSIRARLVVAADGANSIVREAAGIGADRWDYDQTAIVTNVTTQRFHEHCAYERFTEDGPLAVLPLKGGRCGLVWTHRPEVAESVLALSDAEFLAKLQGAFGFRLGRFLRVGQRFSYGLALTRSAEYAAERLAVVGNAAQGLHPIAGQGFNIGLRDAASLAEVVADARLEGTADAGARDVLASYAAWRDEDRRRIVAFTDGLVRLFGSPLGMVRRVRSLGLLAFDSLPPAKSAMARLSVGAAGRVPRLARGVPLQGAR
jgi:2-octaprenyl-6-methoxyphenol hydroxylase